MATALSVNQFEHRCGDDETLTVPITDANGAAVNCTSGSPTMTLSVVPYPGAATATATQATSGITLTGTSTGVTIAMTEAVFASTAPGMYYFTITRTASGTTKTYPVVGFFTLLLLPKST